MSSGTLSTFSKTVFACLHENSRLPILTPLHNINRQNVKANKFILGRLGNPEPRPCCISCRQNIYFCLLRRLIRQKQHFTNVHNFGRSRKSRFHTAAFEIVLMWVLGQYAGQLIRFQTNMVTIRRFLLMCQVEGVVG